MKALRILLGVILLAATSHAQQVRIETDDGLALRTAPDGRATGLSVDGAPLAAPAKPGGFVLTDMEAELPASANMIGNASAEDDADGDGMPDGWTLGADWEWDTAVARSGKRSLKVNVPPGPNVRSSGSLVLARLAVEPGRRYMYSFWAKTKGCEGRYPSCTYIRQYDADGKTCAPQRGLGTRKGTNDWFRVRMEFQPKPETRFIDVYANIWKSHGTCWYDDFCFVPVDASETSVGVPLKARDGVLTGRGISQQIALDAEFRRQPGRIRADVTLTDLTKQDRRIVVGYDIPIDADGWTWWDNICANRKIDGPADHEWCTRTYLGEGKLSIYPFNSLAGERCGVTLGVPLDQGPRIWRVEYDNVGKRLKIRFAFGLTQDTRKFPGKASFSFILYRHDPRWGMRAAAKRFYEFYPECFVKRFPFEAYLNYANMESVTPDGDMNARGDILVDAADFGESVPLFAHMHGGYACDFMPTERTDAPNDKEVLEYLAKHAKEIGDPPNSYTPPSQILKQITYDPEGNIRFHRKDLQKAGARYARPDSGGWFFEFRVMEDPEVCNWLPGLLDRRMKQWLEKHPNPKPFHYCMSSDEIQGYTGTGSRADYRREHFQFADVPLSFHKQTLTLGRINLMYDFLKTFLWPHSQEHKYLTTGNANSFNRSFCFPYVDMGMVEWEWDRTNPLRTGAYIRGLSYHKLYRFWRVCGKGEEDPASVITHLHRGLYWAIYPAVGGMQSKTHNLDEYRHLYRRYVPIMERLSAAGWEPVTHASASPEGILVERYGEFENGTLHFTIRNISEGQMIDLEDPKPKDVTVSINIGTLGIPGADSTLSCEELTTVRYLALRQDGGKLLLDLAIPNGETRVVHVSNREGRAAFAKVADRQALERMLRFYEVDSIDDVKNSPRSKNAVQLAKLTYRRMESASLAASDECGVRVHVPNWPEAFKNRDATITIGLENISREVRRSPNVTVRSPFPTDMVAARVDRVPEEIRPGERKDVAIHLRVRDDIPRDILPLCVTVLDRITRVVDVRVRTLAPQCELLPERLSTVSEPQQLLLVMGNPFKQTTVGEVEIVPPKGLTIENAKHVVEISPEQSRRVTCLVTLPEKLRDGPRKFHVRFTPKGQKAVESLHALRLIGNRKRCKAAALAAAPKIDGKLDDAVWANAGLMDDFRNPKNPIPVKAATRVKVGQLGDSIYFGIDCDESQMDALRATVEEHNGPVQRDDHIEIHLAPGHKKDVFVFRVNALGTRSSSVTDDWEAAATKGEKRFSIEVRIPLKAVSHVAPDPGEVWGFNMIRQRRAGGGERTQWSQSNWTWGDPVFYGDLIFAAQPQDK